MLKPNYTGHRKDAEMLYDYFQLFKVMQTYPTRILEIGVDEGGSLFWLNDLFNPVVLLGLDNKYPNKHFFEHNERLNIDFLLADQKNMDTALISDYGFFDLIIDDASHNRDLTIKSIHDFWPMLQEKGTYIVEDWPAWDMGNFYQISDELAKELEAEIYKMDHLIAFIK